MIKIRKDNKELIVTKGVYENLYKSEGYKIVDDKKPTIEEPKQTEIVEKISNKKFTKDSE